ncbi:MAG: HEAT repeat domain-containing protein [Candidatus Rokubacteria bacterium]|nr:HEAT repeat domain-containing protein [Candidatus Rokubacteria bacterium]
MTAFAGLALTLTLLLPGPPGGSLEGETTVGFEVQGERLTLQAHDAPLAVILARLAETLGIVFRLEAPVQERVSVELDDVSLDEGLRHLLRHRNTLFVYDQFPGPPSTVYVFGPLAGTLAAGTSAGMKVPAAEPAADREVDILAPLEAELSALSVAESPEGARLLQDLLSDPERSVRITALHWLAGRREALVDALATALRDSDALVQRVAIQIILDRGVDHRQVEDVMAAAEVDDEAIVRQTLSALFTQ